jgi:hypothetical protein
MKSDIGATDPSTQLSVRTGQEHCVVSRHQRPETTGITGTFEQYGHENGPPHSRLGRPAFHAANR